MREVLVSVVIVSFNGCSLLRACLASVIAASGNIRGDSEIIVVDNGSNDGSAGMVSRQFPTVKVIQNSTNLGFAAACNQGIRESSGRYVLLLNPDTEVSDGFLLRLVQVLESEPRAAAAGPRVFGKDNRLQVSCHPLPTLGRELWRLCHLDRLHPLATYPIESWSMTDIHPVEALQGACILLRRAALKQAGLLDERFFMYSEEMDLCRRLVQLGWTIYWVPTALIKHYGAGSTDQAPAPMFLQLYRSKIQYFRKHLGVAGAVAYKLLLVVTAFPRLLSPYLIAAGSPARSRELRAIACNYRSLLRRLPTL